MDYRLFTQHGIASFSK